MHVRAHSSWITNMVHALESNGLDGSAESKPCPVKRIKTRFNGTDRSVNQTKTNVFDAASIQEASPEETMKACSWDNVNALYRKSSLLARSVSRCPIWRGHVLGIGYAHSKRQNWLHPSIQSLALPPSTSRVHPKAGFLHPLLALPSLWMLARTSPMWGISHTIRALKTLIWHARIFNPVVLIKWLNYNHQIAKESTEITEEFLKAVQSGDAALNTLYSSFGTQSPMATPNTIA